MSRLKHLFAIILLMIGSSTVAGQIYFTRSGNITFTSDAPLEKITAHNTSASSVINLETGEMEFAVLINAFQFKKSLMQQHFNENYLESAKFPKAKFKGTFSGFTRNDLTQSDSFQIEISGALTIHGVTNEIRIPGIFQVDDGSITGSTTFSLSIADYDIEIPKLVSKKIAEVVEVQVDVKYVSMDTK